jgi:hypothetical protein
MANEAESEAKSDTKSDAECIEAAYEDAVAGLYKQFFVSLTGQPDKEKQLVAIFANGLQFAKKARALALGVVQPSTITPSALVGRTAAPRAQKKPASR